MKCAIITFTYGDNYGQRLQNLAMQQLLKKYFSEVYTLRQIPPRKSLKQKIKQIINKQGKLNKIRHYHFEAFDKKFISYYPVSISEDMNFPEEKFDYFVVGSDQVWSPFSPDVNSTMFLTFTSPEKRIALSPSLSCDYIPDKMMGLYSRYLKEIEHISTREYQGSKIVSEIIGKDVPTLLDPTLMFDDTFWNAYLEKVNFELPYSYCLCYCLGTGNQIRDIQRICDNNGLDLIDIMSEEKYAVLGPGEFLHLIKNAKLVITDSYHGTIFSYIFKIPFLNFIREGTEVNMNSRFDTLYKKMKIEPRIMGVFKGNIFDINFDYIEKNIREERLKVKNYLDDIFKD